MNLFPFGAGQQLAAAVEKSMMDKIYPTVVELLSPKFPTWDRIIFKSVIRFRVSKILGHALTLSILI